MNKQQLIAMWIGIITFTICVLFPPFVEPYISPESGFWKFSGFHFYLTNQVIKHRDESLSEQQGGTIIKSYPLNLEEYNKNNYKAFVKLDYNRLVLQCLIIIFLTCGVLNTIRTQIKIEPEINNNKHDSQ